MDSTAPLHLEPSCSASPPNQPNLISTGLHASVHRQHSRKRRKASHPEIIFPTRTPSLKLGSVSATLPLKPADPQPAAHLTSTSPVSCNRRPSNALLPNPTSLPVSPKLITLSTQPAFDLIVVGCGGGPCEDNLSSYFLKSHRQTWEDGFAALEAGSGMGAVSQLLSTLTASGQPYGPFWDFKLPPTSSAEDGQPRSSRSLSSHSLPIRSDVKATPLPTQRLAYPPSKLAGTIYSSLHSFCVTHAHFDHIASLVLSAGALHNAPKTVWGMPSTLEHLVKVFEGGLWPHLADYTGKLPLWLRR